MRTTLATICFWVGFPCALTAAMLIALSVVEGVIGEVPTSDRFDLPTHSVRLLRVTGPVGVVCLTAWALLRERVSRPSPRGTSRR